MKRDQWCAVIYCDYGNPKNKRIIRLSYSDVSAENSWKRFSKVFSRNGYRCWQEDRKGNIIHDSKQLS